MLSVTFSQAIVIEPNALASLLSLANVPATVEPYLNGNSTPEPAVPAKRTRKSAASSPAAPAPAAGDCAEKPKRTRRTKAEMAALRAGEAPAATETAAPAGEAAAQTTEAETAAATTTPAGAAPEKPKRVRKPKADKDVPAGAVALDSDKVTPAETISAEGLLERFAKLIDADFAAAKKLLDEFGVNRFSDLAPTDHAAFQAKLVELGV